VGDGRHPRLPIFPERGSVGGSPADAVVTDPGCRGRPGTTDRDIAPAVRGDAKQKRVVAGLQVVAGPVPRVVRRPRRRVPAGEGVADRDQPTVRAGNDVDEVALPAEVAGMAEPAALDGRDRRFVRLHSGRPLDVVGRDPGQARDGGAGRGVAGLSRGTG
jgi:hypothetical protein